MTPRYRTAFSVPSGFAAATPAAEASPQKSGSKVRGKVSSSTRPQSKSPRGDLASKRDSAAA